MPKLHGQALKVLSHLAHSISPGLPGSTSSHVPSLSKPWKLPTCSAPTGSCLNDFWLSAYDGLHCLVPPEDSCSSFKTWSGASIIPCQAAMSSVIMLYFKDLFCIPPLDWQPLGGRNIFTVLTASSGLRESSERHTEGSR